MQTYEDLEVWEMAAQLAERIGNEPALSRGRDGLGGQIRHASVSVASNIAEGWGRRGEVEPHHYLVMAHGSCAEVQAQLRIAYRCGYLPREAFVPLLDLATRIGWMLRSFMRRLRPPP